MAGNNRNYFVYRVNRDEGIVTVGRDKDGRKSEGKTVAEWSRLYGEDTLVKIFDTKARRG